MPPSRAPALAAAARPTAPPTTASRHQHNTPAAATLTAAQERREQIKRMQAESITWREKYKNAFPSFVFYFDSVEAVTEHNLRLGVQRQGSSVDNFFSKKVTHLVTSRPIPINNKENVVHSPSVASKASALSTVGPVRNNKRTSISTSTATPKNPSKSYLSLDGQKLKRDGGLPPNPFLDSQDVLSKALEFGLKVWRVDKLQNILDRLDSNSPNKPTTTAPRPRKLSLPSLLRDEQLYGTRERDPFVPRADTYYFPPKNYYLLVEDSTAQHRPIVVKEYERQPKGVDPQWPVLWGGVEGRSGFYHYTGPPIPFVPPQPAPAPPTVQAAKLVPAVAARAIAPGLRRTLSLKNMGKPGATTTGFEEHHHLEAAATIGKPGGVYLAASGNSMPITSNVTTTSTAVSAAAHGGGANSKGSTSSLLAATNRQVTFPMRSHQQLLGRALAPGKLKRSVSVDAGLNARAPPAREEPKKPGYCENCRVKYEDFKQHIVSRKHKKFATNDENWIELDELLSRVTRPLLYPLSESDEEEEEDLDEEMSDAVDEAEDDNRSFEGDSGYFDGEGEATDHDCKRDGAIAAE